MSLFPLTFSLLPVLGNTLLSLPQQLRAFYLCLLVNITVPCVLVCHFYLLAYHRLEARVSFWALGPNFNKCWGVGGEEFSHTSNNSRTAAGFWRTQLNSDTIYLEIASDPTG